jgi:hypothetical protein
MKKKFEEGGGELSIAKKDGDIDGSQLTPKQRFALLIENYKKQNPAKYEQKKALLEKQLGSL